MNGELHSLYIDSNYATKDASNRYTYDLIGGVTVPEGARVYVDNISFTNTFSEKVDDKSDELYVKTRTHNNLRDPSGVLFNWTYNGVLNDHLLAGTYAIKQPWYFADLATTATTWATQACDPKTIVRISGLDLYNYESPTGTEKLFVKNGVSQCFCGGRRPERPADHGLVLQRRFDYWKLRAECRHAGWCNWGCLDAARARPDRHVDISRRQYNCCHSDSCAE